MQVTELMMDGIEDLQSTQGWNASDAYIYTSIREGKTKKARERSSKAELPSRAQGICHYDKNQLVGDVAGLNTGKK